jgi:hypothetical protein
MRLVEGYVASIVLVNEDYVELSEADKNTPAPVRAQLEKDRADDMLLRRAANNTVRSALQHYARSNDIEIIGETDLDAQEVLDTTYPIVQLSAIAQADWEARGIPIPAHLQGKNDTERIRAADEVAKQKATKAAEKLAKEKQAEEDAELARMEAEEKEKNKI